MIERTIEQTLSTINQRLDMLQDDIANLDSRLYRVELALGGATKEHAALGWDTVSELRRALSHLTK